MIKVKYTGGLEAVEVALPSGRNAVVQRNHQFECLPNEADALLASPEWKLVKGDEDDIDKLTNYDKKDAD